MKRQRALARPRGWYLVSHHFVELKILGGPYEAAAQAALKSTKESPE